jgi:hypothetical protein
MHTLALLLLLAGCDGFGSVQRADTIEAYEAWIAEHPSSSKLFQANIRLEELYLQAARETATLEAWDRYLERFPEGTHREKALEERESFLFARGEQEGSAAAWQAFVDQYPKARQGRGQKAKAALEAATYAQQLEITPLRDKPTNLAEDPNGPMNGVLYEADVLNKGERTITRLVFHIVFEDAAGKALDRRTWPLVAPSGKWGLPMPEEASAPIPPGGSRTWSWMTEAAPEGTASARLQPMAIDFADAG